MTPAEPTSMDAAVWETNGSIQVVSKPIPALPLDHVLIKVAACGICGSDLHICHGKLPYAKRGVIIGHEFSGHVVRVHASSAQTRLSVGDLVAVDPNIPCQGCGFCRGQKYHLCPDLKIIGLMQDGGMADYAIVPLRNAVRVPEGTVSPAVASLAEPLACAIHAVDLGAVKTGDRVLVIGGGPIGLMTAATSVLSGARVSLIEPNAARRTMAKQFGVSDTFAPGELAAADPFLDENAFDVVFETVGRAQTMEEAISHAKAGGVVVWVGVAARDARVTIRPFEMYRRELTIRTSRTSPYCMHRAVKMLANPTMPWAAMITHQFPMENFQDAWQVLVHGQGVKVCITP
ncbi:chaperonin 10-like protein [Gongronella butleri]|nr:chaperonin 10-like protein [Gongronella butleri]